MRTSLMIKQGLAIVLVAVGLSACGGGTGDLDEYINEVKTRKGGVIDPLPEITPYEVFSYIADKQGIRSPFRPDTPQSVGGSSGLRPDVERSRVWGKLSTGEEEMRCVLETKRVFLLVYVFVTLKVRM